jgi:integrase
MLVSQLSSSNETNGAYRARKHFEPAEVEAIADAAWGNRDGARDWLMIVMAYRHGLRVGELTELRWTDVREQRLDRVAHLRTCARQLEPLPLLDRSMDPLVP